MLIKFCGKNLFDVFCGKGWDNWTRFEVVANNNRRLLKFVSGASVPEEEMRAIRRRFTGAK